MSSVFTPVSSSKLAILGGNGVDKNGKLKLLVYGFIFDVKKNSIHCLVKKAKFETIFNQSAIIRTNENKSRSNLLALVLQKNRGEQQEAIIRLQKNFKKVRIVEQLNSFS